MSFNTKELTRKETDFIFKAMKKISLEGTNLVNDIEENDVRFTGSQLITELDYVIKGLQDPVRSWSQQESDMIIDYYTIQSGLYNIPFSSYMTTPTVPIKLESKNTTLSILKTELTIYITMMLGAEVGVNFLVFNSILTAFQVLGPGKKFYWSEDNYDGVSSPNNSLIGVTKEQTR